MGAFVDDILLDSRETIEDDGTRSTPDIVDGVLGEDESNSRGDSQAEGVAEVGHYTGVPGEL